MDADILEVNAGRQIPAESHFCVSDRRRLNQKHRDILLIKLQTIKNPA